MNKKVIRITTIILLVMILILTALFMFLCRNQIKSYANALKYETRYKQSQDPVDLLNEFYFLDETSQYPKRLECAKELNSIINVITAEVLNKSNFAEDFSEYPHNDPKEFIVCMYLMELLISKDYDLYVQEYSFYYSEAYSNAKGDTLMYFQDIAFEVFRRTKDIRIIESTVKAYEQIIDSTKDNEFREFCQRHIDILNEFLEQATQKETSIN